MEGTRYYEHLLQRACLQENFVITIQVSLTSGEEESCTRPWRDLETKARFKLRVPNLRTEVLSEGLQSKHVFTKGRGVMGHTFLTAQLGDTASTTGV